MVILGLTGSIGMGKSTAAKMFRRLGVPVFDSDKIVHQLMGPGGAALAEVGAAFPGVVRDGAVDRQRLGKLVFGDGEKLARLEAIIHVKVGDRRQSFLRQVGLRRIPLVVFDVPLLFETGGEVACDATVLVSAPPFVQAGRVLARDGMTEEKFAAILRRQMPDREKRRRADFIVLTGRGKRETLRHLTRIVTLFRGQGGRHWRPAGQHRGRHAANRS